MYNRLGKGWPFPATGCPVPDLGNIYLIKSDLCMGNRFCIHPPPYDVSAHGLSLKKTDLTGQYHGC